VAPNAAVPDGDGTAALLELDGESPASAWSFG